MNPAPEHRWGDRVVRRDGNPPFLAYEPRPRHVGELFGEAEQWLDRECVVHRGRRLSFVAVLAGADRVARRLADHGVDPGDRVVVAGANSAEWVMSFVGAIRVGGIPVLANAWWSENELGAATVLTGATAVLHDSSVEVPDCPGIATLPMAIATVDDSDRLDGWVPPDPTGDEDDPAVVLFTSGSSGPPKGAVLSHRAVIALQHTLLHLTKRLPHQRAEPPKREVNVQSGPLFHIGGLQALLRAWLLGGTLVFGDDRFDPREVVALLEAERADRWGGVPTMVRRVLDLEGVEHRDLTSVRSLTIGGSAVAPELVARVGAVFPNAALGVSQIYGLSEAGGTLTMASGRDQQRRPGTSGRALPVVELRIADADAEGVGEVLARSPAQMSGYWGQPDDDPFDIDGWLRTGDLGRLDEDGYLFIVGRAKDVIIRGGENIAAAHVESGVATHPAVADVAVIGLPDEDLGEVVAAVVHVRAESVIDTVELADWARQRLAYFEVPSRWWFTDEPLPTTPSGKIDKRALMAAFPAPAAADG